MCWISRFLNWSPYKNVHRTIKKKLIMRIREIYFKKQEKIYSNSLHSVTMSIKINLIHRLELSSDIKFKELDICTPLCVENEKLSVKFRILLKTKSRLRWLQSRMLACKNVVMNLPLNVVIESDGLNVCEFVSHLNLDMEYVVYH
jgi:hypothetical protein